MKYILSIIISTLFFLPVLSQNGINEVQERELQDKVASCINKYAETIQKLQFQNQEEDFLSLFSSQAMVYDDLFGISFKDNIPVKEYSHILATKANDYHLKIYDLVISFARVTNNDISFTATFKKEATYKNEYGVTFHPKSYFKGAFSLTAEVVFSDKNDEPKITKISGSIPSGIQRPQQNICIIEPQEGLDEVRVDGRYPKYDEYSQAYTTSVATLTCDNPNLRVQRRYMPADAHIIKYKVAAKRFAFKPYYGYCFNNSSTLSGVNIKSQNSSFMDFGLDFGVNILAYNRFRIYIFTGFDVEKNKIDVSQEEMNYEYETDQDIDKEQYIRKYSNVNMSQTLSFFDYTIPLYVDFELPLHNNFSLYADLGARFSFAGKTSASALSGTYSVIGKYPQYEGLILDYTSGLNGFTEKGTLTDDNRSSNYNVNRQSNPIKLMGQLGLRIHSWNGLFLDLAARYMRCLTKESATSEGAAENCPLRYDINKNTETVNAFGNECRQPVNQFTVVGGLVFKL